MGAGELREGGLEHGELGCELVDVRFVQVRAVGLVLLLGLSRAGEGPEADAPALHGWWEMERGRKMRGVG